MSKLIAICLFGLLVLSSCQNHKAKTADNASVSVTKPGAQEPKDEHKEDSNQSDENSSSESSAVERVFGEVQPPSECTLQKRKKFVYDVMHDSYLWADETKTVDYRDDIRYPDEETLLDDLKNPKDRFSFIMTLKEYDDFFQAGKSVGFGIFFQPLAHVSDAPAGYTVDSLALLLVYPGSPAAKAGLRRGDQVIALDNYDIDRIFNDTALFKRYFEENEPIEAQFHVRRNDGSTYTVSITKAEYDVKSVIRQDIVDVAERKVGYLLFQAFVGTSEAELNSAFSYFRQNGIDDLILDLRYNGGGYVYIARQLASLIGGVHSSGKVFNQTLFNRKYSRYNDKTYFYPYLQHQLSLPRLFVITTNMTCSASELVINALRASVVGVEVVEIGEHTCGKPYAMIGAPYCDKYLLPVQMKNANADGEGDYVDGLPPTCRSADDYLHDFVDPREEAFAAARYYIEYGDCKPQERTVRRLKVPLPVATESFRSRYGIY